MGKWAKSLFGREKFDIDMHLASIIEDPEDRTNVYKK